MTMPKDEGGGGGDDSAGGRVGDEQWRPPAKLEAQSPDSLGGGIRRQNSDADSVSTMQDYPSEPPTPENPQALRHRHRRQYSAPDALGSSRLFLGAGDGKDAVEEAGEESSYSSEDEARPKSQPSSSWYHDFSDESADDGSWRREVPLLRRGRKTRRQIKQRVDNLMQEIEKRKELFKRRRDSLAHSVNEGLRHQWISNQERLVLRSRQMTAKLLSGRARAWRHKWVFALVQADFAASFFWFGRSPETYYMYYSAQVAIAIGTKALDYRVKAQHYYLMDFCFYANLVVLLWLWVFPTWGGLFNAAEGVCGLLAISVMVFRNSCVPHDFVRMTNAHVHYPAVICMMSLKLNCAGDHCLGMQAGQSERWYLRLRDAYAAYLTWATVYASIIFLLARKRIDRKQRDTLYKYFAEVLGWKDKLPKWLRPYPQAVFMCGHQVLFLSGVGWLLLPAFFQFVASILMMTVFWHNGGRFYVDHFWKAYERNTAQYVDAACSVVLSGSDGGPKNINGNAERKSGDEAMNGQLAQVELSEEGARPRASSQ